MTVLPFEKAAHVGGLTGVLEVVGGEALDGAADDPRQAAEELCQQLGGVHEARCGPLPHLAAVPTRMTASVGSPIPCHTTAFMSGASWSGWGRVDERCAASL